MVTLTVKNKIQLKLDKLLTDAGKVSAVPDRFIMTSGEYTEFVRELQVMSEATRQSVVVGNVTNESESFILNRQVRSTTHLSPDEINALVTKWVCNHYTITYSGIPIIYHEYL